MAIVANCLAKNLFNLRMGLQLSGTSFAIITLFTDSIALAISIKDVQLKEPWMLLTAVYVLEAVWF